MALSQFITNLGLTTSWATFVSYNAVGETQGVQEDMFALTTMWVRIQFQVLLLATKGALKMPIVHMDIAIRKFKVF